MQRLTPEGQQLVENLAQRYGTSIDAVLSLLEAVVAGNGTMAQFNHPELGGSGQWMQGGMTMVGDMFNYALKAKVEGLCAELAQIVAQQPILAQPAHQQPQYQGASQFHSSEVSLFVPATGSSGSHWWPTELGTPSTTGAQNAVRYAYFPMAKRLAVEINGQTTLYDTLDHQIGGASQQQSGDSSVTFTSQFGLVSLATLPIITSDRGLAAAAASPTVQAAVETVSPASTETVETASMDILDTIERLAKLHKKGILSETEFATKKAELLSRL